MAVLIARADGNLTAAATWGVANATAALDSEAAQTTTTTAYVETATFTPGAITIDAIAVKIAARPLSTGTISVRVAQAAATVAGTEVTINVSDLESVTGQIGWYLFKFAAPVTLIAATLYSVSVKTSINASVTMFRNATAGNWARHLRTTTTGAPAAGDSMLILGEWTAAATKTNRAVTMDSTAATDYGDGVVANNAGFEISKGGTLTWGTTAATAYILRLSTRLRINIGGTMTMGTTGTPCPRDGSQQLEFDSAAADGDFGLVVYGTLSTAGLSRTIGKDVVRCLLNTDEAAGQTVLGVSADTGWLTTDEVGIASTSQTPSEAETRILNGGAGASSITVSVAITNAHSGTSPTQAEVVLLTRNVRIKSVSSTFMAYVYFGSNAIVTCAWTQFRYLGSATSGQRGIEVDVTSAGSLAMTYCSAHEFDNHGIYVNSATADNFTISDFVAFKVAPSANQAGIRVSTTTGTNWSLSNIDIIVGNNAGNGISLFSYGGTLTTIRLNSASQGLLFGAGATVPESIHKTWNGFEIHTTTAGGLVVDGLDFGRLGTVNVWRCGSGLATGGVWLTGYCGRLVIETGNFFGNGLANISFPVSAGSRAIVCRSVNMNGDTTFATTHGVNLGAVDGTASVELENCDLGTVSGIKTAHTNDFNCGGTGQARYAEVVLRNTKLSSATAFLNQSRLRGKSFIRYERVNQVTNVHKTVYPMLGTITYDAAVFRTAAPSQSLTPSGRGAGEKLESSPMRARVASAATVTFSVYVRKSAAYVGSAPRLMQRANPAIGVLVDTVLATHSAAADTWQQLSATTAAASEAGVAEFYVDCDGAAGVVYLDDAAGA